MHKKAWSFRKTESGMTLVEILAAVVIMSIVAGTVFAIYGQSHAASVRDNERLTALHLAQTVLNEWTALPDNNHAALNDVLKNHVNSPNAVMERDLTDPHLQTIWNGLNYQGYTPVIRFRYLNHEIDGPVQVTVTVESPNRVSVSLVTLVVPSSP